MANLSITEYHELARDISGYKIPAGQVPANVYQNITFTTSSVQSAAFSEAEQKGTYIVRIVSDVDARVAFGADPTAVASGPSATTLLKAGAAEFFGVTPGHKVAVITAA